MSSLAHTFRQLHAASEPLRLPNAWDAGSARLFESLGAKAIATTSAGVAWSNGYPDGRTMPADTAIQVAASIARVLHVPLTVDIENGYADQPAVVAQTVLRFMEAGVVGINIEDGPDAPELLAAKIEAIKNAAAGAGADIFINARTDVYLASLVEDDKRVDEVLLRAARYRSAGADGLFVPGLSAPADIEAVVAAVGLPLNVMAWPSLSDASALAQLGVRRLSAGSGIPQVLWGHAARLAQDFLETGSSTPMGRDAMSYAHLQALFVGV